MFSGPCHGGGAGWSRGGWSADQGGGGAGDGDQVVGEDAPADPPLQAGCAVVKAASQAVGALEVPDAPERFADVIAGLRRFLQPLVTALRADDERTLGTWRRSAWSAPAGA